MQASMHQCIQQQKQAEEGNLFIAILLSAFLSGFPHLFLFSLWLFSTSNHLSYLRTRGSNIKFFLILARDFL